MSIGIAEISKCYDVHRISEADIPAVLRLCRGNELFYRFHPPLPSEESIARDMAALPPRTDAANKLYIGFFDGEALCAVADLILGYPERDTLFIGFFMVDSSRQGKGIGCAIVSEIMTFARDRKMKKARLAVDEGNVQSLSFWRKNGFEKTGERVPNDFSAYLPMERGI